MEYEYYNNFTIGTANHFGQLVYVVRPSKYADENWGDDFGNEFGELGSEFWGETSTKKEAESMIDAFVNDLDTREVA
jgi:hypothetical protein|tara:strand:- start:2933 stop:3163 length:231 start_codon:yes stop_codon:yes gene_type:complete